MDLEETFIIYDTRHYVRGIEEDFEFADLYYQYHNGENANLLLLCLISDTGAFFTALRKDNAENREKYGSIMASGRWVPFIGDNFDIIIKEG